MTPADIAELAYAEVLTARPRTPERRAAACLYVAATVSPARSVDAVRSAIATIGADTTQQAALELLGRLTAMPRTEEPA